MKECFLITSYCDTDEKIKILKDTISKIKKFDTDVAIHAHFPLSVEIQNEVNHYICSENKIKDNLVLWYSIYRRNYKLYNYFTNLSYYMLKQFEESIGFLFELDYDVIHNLNYDSNITEELYLKSKENLNNNLSVFYQNFFNKVVSASAIWFSILRKDKDYFINSFKYDTYSKVFHDFLSIENYLGYCISNFPSEIKFVTLNEYDFKELYENELSFYGNNSESLYSSYSENYFEEFFKKDGYSIFGGYFNEKLAFLFYDIEASLDIIIKLKDKRFRMIVDDSEVFFFDTTVNISDIKENELNVEINGIEIDKELISRILKNKIEIHKIKSA